MCILRPTVTARNKACTTAILTAVITGLVMVGPFGLAAHDAFSSDCTYSTFNSTQVIRVFGHAGAVCRVSPNKCDDALNNFQYLAGIWAVVVVAVTFLAVSACTNTQPCYVSMHDRTKQCMLQMSHSRTSKLATAFLLLGLHIGGWLMLWYGRQLQLDTGTSTRCRSIDANWEEQKPGWYFGQTRQCVSAQHYGSCASVLAGTVSMVVIGQMLVWLTVLSSIVFCTEPSPVFVACMPDPADLNIA